MRRPDVRSFRTLIAAALIAGAAALPRCGSSGSENSSGPPPEAYSGGDTTIFDDTAKAFSLGLPNLSLERRRSFATGNSFFERTWVVAPASAVSSDGLGPVFNAISCSSCHTDDGRGRPPLADGEPFEGLLVRLSIPGTGPHGEPVPDPAYGGQFNHQSIPGVDGEGEITITYTEAPGTYPDGDPYSLRVPEYEFADLNFGSIDDDIMISPRVGPSVFGLGLIAAIDTGTLEDLADPDDTNGDGISGRPNYVWDALAGETRIGRFGWKANVATLEEQSSGAFLGDIGITSPLFPVQNCTAAQTACGAAPNGGTPEIDQEKIDFITFYMHTLAVPGTRDWDDPDVIDGRRLFDSVRCSRCHLPVIETGTHPDFPELSNQTIRPFTDLLLHDMGPDLADGRPDFLATGSEWRTPPLWGIGLQETVNGHTFLLHDGRARNLEEAILWHGGEAAQSRDLFKNLSRTDRAKLVRFLESL